MKKLSKIYRWILISVLLQTLLLAYLNFIYLPGSGSIKATAYELTEEEVKDRSVRIPGEASDLSVSHDGAYVAYRLKDHAEIIEVKNGKRLKTIEPKGGEIAYFRWLPDRDMLIYSITQPEGEKGSVEISTYDLGASVDRSYPRMKELREGSRVVDIELSPLTNVVYAAVNTGKSQLKIYRYNIMDNLRYVMTVHTGTVIKQAGYSDHLAYQEDNGKVYVRSGKSGSKESISFKGEIRLLGLDADDRIFVGEVNDQGKVTGIRFGKRDQKESSWKQVKADAPIEPAHLYVTPDGKIYRAAAEEGRIYSVGGSSSIAYEGELLDILKDYAVSRDGNRLKLTVLQKS